MFQYSERKTIPDRELARVVERRRKVALNERGMCINCLIGKHLECEFDDCTCICEEIFGPRSMRGRRRAKTR